MLKHCTDFLQVLSDEKDKGREMEDTEDYCWENLKQIPNMHISGNYLLLRNWNIWKGEAKANF